MTVNYGLVYRSGNTAAIKKVVEDKIAFNDNIVKNRIDRNVRGNISPISKETLWFEHIACLLTSQQKSNYDDPVPTFLRKRPFPLSYDECFKEYQKGDLSGFVRETLQSESGIRFVIDKIPEAVLENMIILEKIRYWKPLLKYAEELVTQIRVVPEPHEYELYCKSHYPKETEASIFVDGFKGFGSKQSRNFWQSLGLTRYVSVLDSRIRKWCIANLQGEEWSKYNLNKRSDYNDMADTLREICLQGKVLPCVFDAAAFATFSDATDSPMFVAFCRGDEGDWQEENF